MQKLLMIICASAILFGCAENTEKQAEVAKDSNWATEHLKGMVQVMEETSYTPDSTGKIGKADSCCAKATTFNPKGYATSYTDRTSDGTVVSVIKIERNENGKLLSSTTVKNEKQVSSIAVSYTEEGKILGAVERDSTGEISRYYTDITENEIGQVLSGKMYDADSSYQGTWTSSYSDGLDTGGSWTDSTGTELFKQTGEVNEQGLLSKIVRIEAGKDDAPAKTTIENYTYDTFDETGNWTQKTVTNENGLVTRVVMRNYTYFTKE